MYLSGRCVMDRAMRQHVANTEMTSASRIGYTVGADAEEIFVIFRSTSDARYVRAIDFKSSVLHVRVE
jgi:hypothetical protein